MAETLSPAATYGVELMYAQAPTLEKGKILESLRRRCGRAEPLGDDPDVLAFVYPEHMVMYDDGKLLPAQSMIALAEGGFPPDVIEPDLRQTWDWNDAEDAVAACRYTVLLTDLIASGLPYQERLSLFHNVTLSVLDVAPAIGIRWRMAQRLVSIEDYKASKTGRRFDPLYPALNIRLFNVDNGEEGETLMDTIGLHAFGLPDLQCHFLALDPDDIASVLYNTGAYIFENGDIIEDGHTITGIRDEDEWRCQHEDALAEPKRMVLDINPGPLHAAGVRD